MKNVYSTLALLLGTMSTAFAQYTTDKDIKKDALMKDSMEAVQYNHALPIWGKKALAKGFSLPYSAGLSVQYIWQQSDIVINNLQIGFNNGPKTNLDNIVRFDGAKTQTSGVNIRPDIWLFPFLNVYAVFAQSKASTSVNCGLWVPDSSNKYSKVTDFSTKANFSATTIGFGLTPTIGIGGFFLAMDMNFTWTDISELDQPAYVFVFGPRIGKNIKFKKKDRSLALWAGGFRVQMANNTSGSLNVSDLFPTDQWGHKIDSSLTKVHTAQQSVDTWWENLSPAEQKNPINVAKHDAANNALGKASEVLNNASTTVGNAESSTVQYSLDKRPKDQWNFIVGAQFQINKSWMIRAEYGFLGSRQQFIGGLQYRFPF